MSRISFVLLFVLLGCIPAGARVAPYAVDANTLILFHMDGNSSAVPNAVPGGPGGVYSVAPGTSAAPATFVSQPGFAGFGGALANTADRGTGVDVNGNGTWNFDGIEPGDRFPMSQLGNRFTLEAMVNLPTLSAGNQHLWGGDGNVQRAFQFRIENGGVLRFDPDPGGTSVAFDLSAVTGPHAFAANQWFHVAMTYDGSGGAGTEVVRFYWTRVDSGATAANLVMVGAAGAVTFNASLAAPLVFGNEGRSSGMGEALRGLLDEGRVSNIARTAGDFIFTPPPVTVAAASGNWEAANPPANTLDKNLATRASAAGDGASITYTFGGETVSLDSVDVAFFNGNSRIYRFDILLSGNGVDWSPALSGATSSGSSTQLERFDLPGTPTATHLRIVGHGFNGNAEAFNSYSEVVINLTGPVTDADDDGLADSWELSHFGTITAQSGTGDPDEDGASNTAEQVAGSNPSDRWSLPGDVDADGLPDAWESENFESLIRNGYDDPDGDGFHNLAELVAGTSPALASSHPTWQPPTVTRVADSIVSGNARLFANGASYGRAINGISFQDQILMTFDGHQYTAWYDQTTLTVFLARRTVDGPSAGPWETVNTGSTFVNGVNGDAHNVISFGICASDGTLHLSWDHHGNTLRYRKSVAGLCTTNKQAWGTDMFNPEQNWLVNSSQPVRLVTYPLFVGLADGGLAMQWRYGFSGSGDNMLSIYNGSSRTWSTPVQFDTRAGTYTEASTSTSRNAYVNGLDIGPDGSMHLSWTYREGAGTSNHDICYAYSNDLGITWRSNSGAIIADTRLGGKISLNSPGILVKRKDMNQLLINQQAQCVDDSGRMHVLMLHRREDPGFQYPNITTANYSINGTAYYHYFRDPDTGRWAQRRIPPEIAPVGSRPTIGHDAKGNLYAAFLTYTDRSQVYPGYRGGYLAIATASRNSSYTDWKVVHTSVTRFNGEPLLDQPRLSQSGVLSVFIQEDSTGNSAAGTALHVIDFVTAPVTDSDGDGLDDAWELARFGRLQSQDGGGDADGDGTDNLTEQRLGLDPLAGTSRFSAVIHENRLSWPGAEGAVFSIERSPDAISWEEIATRTGTAGINTFLDPEPPAGRAFYRVLLRPRAP